MDDIDAITMAPYQQRHKDALPIYFELFSYDTHSVGLMTYLLRHFHHFIDAMDLSDLAWYDRMMKYATRLYQHNGSIDPTILTMLHTITERYKPALAAYPTPLILRLSSNIIIDPSEDTILFTITTCKRFDLFEKTMNSFLRCCLDHTRITTFYCVDDNSSQEDRAAMKERYPFFEFYFKSEQEKGHRVSMNRIWNLLQDRKPTWWLHMEDDWLFIQPDHYISKFMEQLKKHREEGIRQVLFNKNYAEIIPHWNFVGGTLIENNQYRLHIQDEPDLKGSNSAYWPHYSFRPALIDTKTILELGNYDSPHGFFERDYANRYAAAKYKSMYRNEISCLHIGKLTSDKKGVNAYTLNGEDQFAIKRPNIKIVNLERRTDRKQAMVSLLSQHEIGPYEFVKAVDGSILELTHEIAALFQGNDFGSRKGFIGCALSHLNIWKELVADKHHTYYIIMEDDIEWSPHYSNQKEVLASMCQYVASHAELDILHLGYSMRRYNEHKKNEVHAEPIIPLDNSTFIGGTFSYIITKQGAKKLLEYILKNGIKHGIDYVIKIMPNFSMSNCQPHFILSDWVDSSNSTVDSDIQKQYQGFDIDGFFSHLTAEWDFYPNLDSFGNDIQCLAGSVEHLQERARLNPRCAGFNTLGYLKSNIVFPLIATPHLAKNGQGLYVKRQSCIQEKEWDFYPNLDSMDHDIGCQKCSIEELKEKVRNRSDVYAVNTAGFMKSKVVFPLVSSPYLMKKGDGIYVKRVKKQ